MKQNMRKNWYMGFFGFFTLYGFVGLAEQNWGLMVWFVWAVWFLFFLPEKGDGKREK